MTGSTGDTRLHDLELSISRLMVLIDEVLQVLLRMKQIQNKQKWFGGTYDHKDIQHVSATDIEASEWFVPSNHRLQAPDVSTLGKPGYNHPSYPDQNTEC